MQINEKMYALGAKSSIIREIFEYAKRRKAEIGAENVFDFSIGNPSIPAPETVNNAMKKLIDTKVKTIDKDQTAELIRMAQKSALRSGYYKIFAQKMLDLFNEDDAQEEAEHKKK